MTPSAEAFTDQANLAHPIMTFPKGGSQLPPPLLFLPILHANFNFFLHAPCSIFALLLLIAPL